MKLHDVWNKHGLEIKPNFEGKNMKKKRVKM